MAYLFEQLKHIFFSSRAKQVVLLCFIVALILLPIQARALNWGVIAAGSVVATGISCFVTAGLGCVIGIGITALTALKAGVDNFLASLINFFAEVITFLTGWIVNFFVTISASLLQVSIVHTLQPLLDQQDATTQVILTATAIVRSMANLILIAILIIIAIATIVGIEAYGVRRLIVWLVLIVLIVNFSNIIVGLPIDAGNTVMRYFWQNSAFNTQNLATYVLNSMSLSSLNIASALNIKLDPSANDSNNVLAAAANKLVILLLGAFAGYIFLRLAILFILRIGIFWILIITAPLVFIVSVLPAGKKYIKTWWTQLLNWSFLGAFVFFFFFFGLIIWHSLNQQFLAGIDPKANNAQAVFVFPIILLFFMYALRISKEMAGTVANGIVDSAISIGRGLTLGTAALVGGAALAGAGRRLLGTERVQRITERLQRSPSRRLQRVGNRLAAAREGEINTDERDRATRRGAFDTQNTPDLRTRFAGANVNDRLIIADVLSERGELDEATARAMLPLAGTRAPQLARTLRNARPDIYREGDDAQIFAFTRRDIRRGSQLSMEAASNPIVAFGLSEGALREAGAYAQPAVVRALQTSVNSVAAGWMSQGRANPAVQNIMRAMNLDPSSTADQSTFEQLLNDRVARVNGPGFIIGAGLTPSSGP